jgi:hypothetical protein
MYIDESTALSTMNKLNVFKYESKFNFLKDHYGLRDGEMHILIAQKGGGKSSLIRSILFDLLETARVYIHLSEEDVLKYLSPLSQAMRKIYPEEEIEKRMKNLLVTSEIDGDIKANNFIKTIKLNITKHKADIFIFDNFTTSDISAGSPRDQHLYATELSTMTKKMDIASLVVVHTKKGHNKNRIADGDDMRGVATLINTAGYIYTLNTFFQLTPPQTILKNDKARYHSKAHQKSYGLKWDDKNNLFIHDVSLTLKEIKEVLKQINEAIK